jgi:GNAT superfamily N-acetyltransferase
LPAIETAAAGLFESLGLADLYRRHTFSQAEFRRAWAARRLFVATDAADRPLGFALAARLGPWAQLAEVDVRPDSMQQGLGRRLVERCVGWAGSQGFDRMVLSTHRTPPWNGPFYARLGFRELRAEEWTAPLRALRAEEARRGFPMADRILMACDFSLGASPRAP